jgi:cold shock CspA family protein
MQMTARGTVLRFGNQGYGFILIENSRRAIFFHLKDVIDCLILREGDLVAFEEVPTARGPKAINVRLVSEGVANESL